MSMIVAVVIRVSTFMTMIATRVGFMVVIVVTMIIVRVVRVAVIIMPMSFFFVIGWDCTTRIETHVGHNGQCHRLHWLLRR